MNSEKSRKKFFKKLNKSTGATVIEYVLLISFIAVALMSGLRRVGSGYTKIYNDISDALDLK